MAILDLTSRGMAWLADVEYSGTDIKSSHRCSFNLAMALPSDVRKVCDLPGVSINLGLRPWVQSLVLKFPDDFAVGASRYRTI